MAVELNELIKLYEDKGYTCLSLSAEDKSSSFNISNFDERKVNTALSSVELYVDEFDKNVYSDLDIKDRQTRGKSYPLFVNQNATERFVSLNLFANSERKMNTAVLFNTNSTNESLYLKLNISSNNWRVVYLADAKVAASTYVCSTVNEGARLELVTVLLTEDLIKKSFMCKEGPDPAGYHFYSLANVGKDAYYRLQQVSLGGVAGGKSIASLNQEGAEAYLDTACFVEDNCAQSYELETIHHNPHTTSDINSYGVVAENARGELIGRGEIDKGAFASNCQQDSRLLALDSSSEALCYPLLLINEYDVIAGHSSGVGQVDEEAVFYLRSRGLTERDSKRLMIAAFLKPNIEKISDEIIREYLINKLDDKVLNRD